jgi:hypothetical protein
LFIGRNPPTISNWIRSIMSIDIYSLCPGGTGKKIKFCCSDFVGELQKIDRMLEGDQLNACLAHIERLETDGSHRACLMSIKGMLFRALEKMEEAAENAKMFVEKYPGNATALAELAMSTAVEKGGRAAMAILQQAVAASSDGIQNRLYEALGVVAQVLVAEGNWLACRALWQLQLNIARDDKLPLEMLVEMYQTPEVSLLFKEERQQLPCPAGVAWKARFDEALAAIPSGNWQAAADELAALAEEAPGVPAIWWNLANVRGWLADTPGCTEALSKYAALDVPLEDAVEAEATAMLLSKDPFADAVDLLSMVWTLRDVERLQTQFLSDKRVAQMPFDPAELGDENNPPPKGMYLLLDRPSIDTMENTAWEKLPCILGQALLYGRQTDREARLEILHVAAPDVLRVKALLGELAGDALDPQTSDAVIGRVSASQDLLQAKWWLPRGITRRQIDALTLAYRLDAVLARWPQMKLGIFDGRAPSDVSAEAAYRVRLLAAVLLLQLWDDHMVDDADFNRLRGQLGLPALEPVDPRQSPLASLPLVRLHRVLVEHCSDDDLLLGFRRAASFGATQAIKLFAKAIVERPGFSGKEEQLRAYHILARGAEDSDRALQYLQQGRQAAEAMGQSSASWDLFELAIQFKRRDGRESMRLIDHIQRQHLEEPGVSESLTRMLIQVGLLRPDGTPAPISEQRAAPLAEQADLAPEPGKLWTPDSQQPAGKGKIWVP